MRSALSTTLLALLVAMLATLAGCADNKSKKISYEQGPSVSVSAAPVDPAADTSGTSGDSLPYDPFLDDSTAADPNATVPVTDPNATVPVSTTPASSSSSGIGSMLSMLGPMMSLIMPMLTGNTLGMVAPLSSMLSPAIASPYASVPGAYPQTAPAGYPQTYPQTVPAGYQTVPQTVPAGTAYTLGE
jgi:hypothetical protein